MNHKFKATKHFSTNREEMLELANAMNENWRKKFANPSVSFVVAPVKLDDWT